MSCFLSLPTQEEGKVVRNNIVMLCKRDVPVQYTADIIGVFYLRGATKNPPWKRREALALFSTTQRGSGEGLFLLCEEEAPL